MSHRRLLFVAALVLVGLLANATTSVAEPEDPYGMCEEYAQVGDLGYTFWVMNEGFVATYRESTGSAIAPYLWIQIDCATGELIN